MLEERLILAVENHPILYDKSLSNYKSATGRENAWKEVYKELNARDEFTLDVENLKKRWRTLRNSFIKHYRAEKMKKSGSAGGKKKKWVYYDQMLFLIPFIEFKETIGSYSQEQPRREKENAITDEEDSLERSINVEDSYDMQRFQGSDGTQVRNNIQDRENSQDRASTRDEDSYRDRDSTHRTRDRDNSQNRGDNDNNDTHVSTQRSTEAGPSPSTSKSIPPKKRQGSVEPNYLGKPNTDKEPYKKRKKGTDDQLMEIITKPADPDEQFMPSCVLMLQRLTPRNNMLARMQIQKVLFDLEFGDTDTSRQNTYCVSTVYFNGNIGNQSSLSPATVRK